MAAPRQASSVNPPAGPERAAPPGPRRGARWLAARLAFYPSLAWNLLASQLRPNRRWWHRVDEHVLLGALPLARHVPALAAEGVKAVINTCEEYAGPQAAYRRAGIEQLRLPTVDYTSPAVEDLERGVAFIRQHAERGHSVYVHCKAGKGRSATLVLCWLIDAHGLAPEAAQQRLAALRPHVMRRLARRPAVREFFARRASRARSSGRTRPDSGARAAPAPDAPNG